MENNKSIEELQKELEELKVKCEQKEHKLHLLEQRGRYIRSKKDRERTHELCVKGGIIKALFPELDKISEPVLYEIFEQISQLDVAKNIIENLISNNKEDT